MAGAAHFFGFYLHYLLKNINHFPATGIQVLQRQLASSTVGFFLYKTLK